MCISSCKCVWDAYSNNTSVLLNASSAVCVCQQPCPLPSQNIKVCSSGPVAFYLPFWWGTLPGDGGCRVRTKLSQPPSSSALHMFSLGQKWKRDPDYFSVCWIRPLPSTPFQNFFDSRILAIALEEKNADDTRSWHYLFFLCASYSWPLIYSILYTRTLWGGYCYFPILQMRKPALCHPARNRCARGWNLGLRDTKAHGFSNPSSRAPYKKKY